MANECTITVRMSELTPEQQAQEDATYRAAAVLRREGFHVEIKSWFCSNARDDASGIVLTLGKEHQQ